VGARVLRCASEEVTGRLEVTDELVAGNGFLWAPVVITLADWLCACGTPLHAPPDFAGFTTVELKSNFLGTVRQGGSILGRARPAHVGRTTQVWDCDVSDEASGRSIALFRCTQMILYPRS
jgi:uncharacterized protein (TIGR00369 family)